MHFFDFLYRSSFAVSFNPTREGVSKILVERDSMVPSHSIEQAILHWYSAAMPFQNKNQTFDALYTEFCEFWILLRCGNHAL